MSRFPSSFKDELTAIEQEMQTLPEELGSIVSRLNRGRLRNLFLRLNQDFNRLFDKLFGTQRSRVLASPFVIDPTSRPFIRLITNADLAKWREAKKSDVQVVIGKGRVEVMAPSELAKEYKTTVPQVIFAAQQQGYTVLGWDQYQKLLDEIGKLIGGDEEPPTIGVPLPTAHSVQEAKVLPKSSSL